MKRFYNFGPWISCLLLIFTIWGCENQDKEEVEGTPIGQKIYQELHRPQFHFSPEENWMNDPNGMFYYEGKYHLFYQYYPDSTVWGPMHWGHAESADLLHWKHLPIALFPDSIGCIFSGSSVVDNLNTSKLGSKDNPPIIAAFTHHNFEGEQAKRQDFQKQSIAYSLDGGYDWIKYEGNPIIPNTEKIKDFRDPKVVWHEPSQKWILVLAAYDRVKFYASSNLLDWEFLSDFGIEGDTRLWECPDLLPIKVAGTNEYKWVLIVSIQKDAPNGGTATSYFVGDFDGQIFKSEIDKQKWLDWGTDNYAFVTWNNIPESDGRIIGIGWMSNWQYAQIVPTAEWRSAMTIPRELSLIKTGSAYSLHSSAVEEIQSLRGKPVTFGQMNITEEKILEESFPPQQAEFDWTIDLSETTAKSFGMKFYNDLGEYFIIEFDKVDQKMYVDRTHSSLNKFSEDFFANIHSAPVSFDKQQMNVRLFMDAASAEIFIDNGEINFTSIFFPSKKFDKVALFSKNGTWSILDAKVFPLNSVWSGEIRN